MVSPVVDVSKNGSQKARLKVISPEQFDFPEIPFKFNPSEYKLQKSNSFAEVTVPGLQTPPIQFVRGNSEKLTTELLVDTTDNLKDVRSEYTDHLRRLMDIAESIHAPPIVKLIWAGEIFKGVIDSLGISYILFSAEGVPLRAKVSLSLKEYKTIEEQASAGKNKESSPDVEKSHIVRRGDTLSAIAHLAYRDASQWREIAKFNDIKDPRRLTPGQVLNIPRLD